MKSRISMKDKFTRKKSSLKLLSNYSLFSVQYSCLRLLCQEEISNSSIFAPWQISPYFLRQKRSITIEYNMPNQYCENRISTFLSNWYRFIFLFWHSFEEKKKTNFLLQQKTVAVYELWQINILNSLFDAGILTVFQIFFNNFNLPLNGLQSLRNNSNVIWRTKWNE